MVKITYEGGIAIKVNCIKMEHSSVTMVQSKEWNI